MHKLARICYNKRGWRRPSGHAPKCETARTYCHQHGYGHEEWLLRNEWLLGGWRYAFVQGVNKSHRQLIKQGKPFDLTLFTIQPDARRRLVATISDLECLDDLQAENALEAFKKRGWYRTMLAEIKTVGGNVPALGNAKWAKHVLNVRFRLENVLLHGPNEHLPAGHPITTLTRYLLYDAAVLTNKSKAPHPRGRRGHETPPSLAPFLRRAAKAVLCTPEHAKMQAKLMAELRLQFPRARIVREKDFIDISVRTKSDLLLFEIKSDLEPRVAIRRALGQLLEYAFHPHHPHPLLPQLVIVGRSPLTPADSRYLGCLRKSFSLPIDYRLVPL